MPIVFVFQKVYPLLSRYWGIAFFVSYKIFTAAILWSGREAPSINDSFNYLSLLKASMAYPDIVNGYYTYFSFLQAVIWITGSNTFDAFSTGYFFGIFFAAFCMVYFLRALKLSVLQINFAMCFLAFYCAPIGSRGFTHFLPSTFAVLLFFLLLGIFFRSLDAMNANAKLAYFLFSSFVILALVFVHPVGLPISLVAFLIITSVAIVLRQEVSKLKGCTWATLNAFSICLILVIASPEKVPAGSVVSKSVAGQMTVVNDLRFAEASRPEIKYEISGQNQILDATFATLVGKEAQNSLFKIYYHSLLWPFALNSFIALGFSVWLIGLLWGGKYTKWQGVLNPSLFFVFGVLLVVFLVGAAMYERASRLSEFVFPVIFIYFGLLSENFFQNQSNLVRRLTGLLPIPLYFLLINTLFLATESYAGSNVRVLKTDIVDLVGHRPIYFDDTLTYNYIRAHTLAEMRNVALLECCYGAQTPIYFARLNLKNTAADDRFFVYNFYRTVQPGKQHLIENHNKSPEGELIFKDGAFELYRSSCQFFKVCVTK